MKRIICALMAILALAACGGPGEETQQHTMLNRYGDIFGMLQWTDPADGKTATATLTRVRFSSYGQAGELPTPVTETDRFTVTEDEDVSLVADHAPGSFEPQRWRNGTEAQFNEEIRNYQAAHVLRP